MQTKPVLDRAGNPTGSYVYNGAAANRNYLINSPRALERRLADRRHPKIVVRPNFRSLE
jgi:hypothetical protein